MAAQIKGVNPTWRLANYKQNNSRTLAISGAEKKAAAVKAATLYIFGGGNRIRTDE